MKTETIQKIKELLINEGYEKEINDILFIEDLDFSELEDINFSFEDLELEEIDFNFELLELI